MTELTSTACSIRVAFLATDATKLEGRIGITLAPGAGPRTSERGTKPWWSRDLVTDLTCLRDEHRARLLVTLMERRELDELGLAELFVRAGELGLDTLHAPIPDMGVPPSVDATVGLVGRVLAVARAGATVVVHCRGGLGRSGTVAACCLVGRGHGAYDAIELVRGARPGAIEHRKQERFVDAFARAARGRWSEL